MVGGLGARDFPSPLCAFDRLVSYAVLLALSAWSGLTTSITFQCFVYRAVIDLETGILAQGGLIDF